MLLPAKVNSISEEQGRKGDVLGAHNIGHVKIFLALLIEGISLHMRVTIIHVGIMGLKSLISEGKVYFDMFLAFNKQF